MYRVCVVRGRIITDNLLVAYLLSSEPMLHVLAKHVTCSLKESLAGALVISCFQ